MTMGDRNGTHGGRRTSPKGLRDVASDLADRTTLLYSRARTARREPTPSERRMWGVISRAGLAWRFRRQTVFRDYYVDLYCSSARFIVEIDGVIHERQREYDARRDAYFRRLGYTVLRFTNADVNVRAEEIVRDLARRFDLYPRPPARRSVRRAPPSKTPGRSAATAWLD